MHIAAIVTLKSISIEGESPPPDIYYLICHIQAHPLMNKSQDCLKRPPTPPPHAHQTTERHEP